MQFSRKTIDCHWHLYTWEDEKGQDFRLAIDQVQKELGLQAINICAIPVYNGLGPAQNILAALYKLHNPTAYAYGGMVYPQRPLAIPMPEGMDPLTQYRELMEIGFDGIKILETKPTEQKAYQIFLDDVYFDPLFAACEQDRTHLIMHVADPATFWDPEKIPQRFLDRGWFYGDGSYLSNARIYEIAYNILARHPQLCATFAHFFFLSGSPEKLEQLFRAYPNVGVDITPGAEMHEDFRKNRDFYRAFFIKYADRIMLGSDLSLRDTKELNVPRLQALYKFLTTDEELHIIVEDTKGLALPTDAADKILSQNFRRAAGDRPRPIDRQALVKYVEKYAHLLTDGHLRTQILKEMRSIKMLKQDEDARRQSMVDEMYALSQVRWQVTEDSLFRDTDCTFLAQTGRIYTGMPYSHATGSMEKLKAHTAEIRDGVYVLRNDHTYYNSQTANEFNVPPDILVVPHIIGLDCSSAIAAVWRRYLPQAGFDRTPALVPTDENCRRFGLRKIGVYSLGEDSATSWDLNFDANAAIAPELAATRDYDFRSIVSDPDGSPNREKLSALYEAYALCRPADVIVFSCRGFVGKNGIERTAGHVRMVAKPPTVVRDGAGRIDPEKSFLVTIEQGKGNLNKSNPYNNDTYSTWGVYVQYSFRELAGIETVTPERKNYTVYVPVTNADFADPPLPHFLIIEKENVFDAVVSSNYGIVYTNLCIDGKSDLRFTGEYPWNIGLDGNTDAPFEGVDASGHTTAEQIQSFHTLRWEACRLLYRSVRLKKHENAFADLSKGTHSYSLTMKITTGEEKTFSGTFLRN